MPALTDPSGIAQPRAPGRDPARADPHRVTDPRRIGQILQRLWESRGLLAVHVAHSDETCTTTVLRVDPARARFDLDELTPEPGHRALLTARSLRALARLDGVEIAFQASVEGIASERGIAVYTLPFPEVLHYAQERAAHRVRVRATPPVAVRLGRADGTEVEAEVKDISVGGLCLRAPTLEIGGLARGDRIPRSELAFPDGVRVQCELEVRYVGGPEGSRWCRLGVRFVNLPGREQTRIAQFILQLERERMRVRPPSGRER